MKKYSLIISLVIASFILGIHYNFTLNIPVLFTEYTLLSDILNKGNSIWSVLNILWLTVSHLGLFALLFSGKLRSSKVYLVLMPLSFMLAFTSNILLLVVMEPALLLSYIPFIALWIFAIAKPNGDGSISRSIKLRAAH